MIVSRPGSFDFWDTMKVPVTGRVQFSSASRIRTDFSGISPKYLALAFRCMVDPSVDVNSTDADTLKTRSTELSLLPESDSQVRVKFPKFATDITPLFLAVHVGNAGLIRKLLSVGTDIWAP
ncbi:Ankyrin repeat [Sesbania bispinosa]|nr:Ankyrin repeat [Sesbania bispinosa]